MLAEIVASEVVPHFGAPTMKKSGILDNGQPSGKQSHALKAMMAIRLRSSIALRQ
jgi:hypothetical protein